MTDIHSASANYIIALVIVFVVFVFWWLLLRKKDRHQRILLMGCSNGGKTALFSQLNFGKSFPTYMSMKENVGQVANDKHRVEIVDIPGNERIGKNLFDEYKNNVKGIIFVVDSESVQKEVKDVAEFMFNLLTDPTIRATCKEILVLCNKQDLDSSKGPAVVQMLLEKELSVLRNLKSKQLDSTSQDTGGKKKLLFLGHKKKAFEFSQLKPINVTFAESILTGSEVEESKFDTVKYWLNKF
ncbi:hypothetical protein V9T40_000538 [Parthenolecanium corni]|uniref:Signal recognition particle receptor subunit beta n=1 Tax=Parthenolecanium corni TaxID=536013 RepID=A0AAN9TD25_9HEMI